MKKRQPAAAKSRKTRQKRVPKNNGFLHEYDRRLRQAGLYVPVKRTPHTKAQRISAAIAIAAIAGLVTLAAYALHLPNNQPNPWQDQGTQTAHR